MEDEEAEAAAERLGDRLYIRVSWSSTRNHHRHHYHQRLAMPFYEKDLSRDCVSKTNGVDGNERLLLMRLLLLVLY